MKLTLACVYILLFVLFGAAYPTDASTLLTFDDLPGHCISTGPARVMTGYGGLAWSFFLTQNSNGMVSPTNVAYPLDSGTDAYIYSANFFDLNSAYLTAENNNGTQVRIQGLVGTNVTYDNTYIIKTNQPTLINFNYLGIDNVKFVSTGSTYFMDNLTVNVGCVSPACKNYVIGWGAGLTLNCHFPTNVVALAAGYQHCLFLKEDGTISACGSYLSSGPVIVPDGLTNILAISGGDCHSLALKADGVVVAWGAGTDGQTNVPADLTNVIAISAGAKHSLALKADGTVVGWGGSGAVIPAGISNVVAITAGRGNSLVLKSDGTVMGWGAGNLSGLTGLSNIVAIGAGDNCCYLSWEALRADGRIITGSAFGGTSGPALSNVVAISVSRGTDGNVSQVLMKDGTVIASGYNFGACDGEPLVPPGLSNVLAVASGDYVYLALIGNGPPTLGPPLLSFGKEANEFTVSVPTRSGRVYRLEYKDTLQDTNWIGLPLVAGNGAIRALTDPTATGPQRFYRVRLW